jgi:hypothetical protein
LRDVIVAADGQQTNLQITLGQVLTS